MDKSSLQKIPLGHVVCFDNNRIIGQQSTNSMPWKCDLDMKHFQDVTLNRVVIMGFNTYLSILQVTGKAVHDNVLTSDPVLRSRISIVIADSDRVTLPENNPTSGACIMSAFLIASPDTKPLGSTKFLINKKALEAGLTIFVPDVQSAVMCGAMVIQALDNIEHIAKDSDPESLELVKRYNPRDVNKPLLYVIGGGAIYQETLKNYNVVEVVATKLPISVISEATKFTGRVNEKFTLYPDILGEISSNPFKVVHCITSSAPITVGNKMHLNCPIDFMTLRRSV